VELSPSEAVSHEHMGWNYLMDRDYPQAVQHCQEALTLDPDFLLATRVLASAYEYQGRQEDAIAEFEKGVELSKGDPVAKAYLARAYAAFGKRDQATQLLNELLVLSKTQYVSPGEIGGVYAALGQPNEAFQWLNKAFADRTSALIYLRVDRVYDPIRKDPRFDQLLKKMNL
jgi:tetratricopeptide (TPR) repeat protein